MSVRFQKFIIFKLLLLNIFFYFPVIAFSQNIQAISAIVNDEVISRYDVQQRVQLIISTSGIKPTDENISLSLIHI